MPPIITGCNVVNSRSGEASAWRSSGPMIAMSCAWLQREAGLMFRLLIVQRELKPGLPSPVRSSSVVAVLKLLAHVLIAAMLVLTTGASAFAHSIQGASSSRAFVGCIQKACAGHTDASGVSAAPVPSQCIGSSCVQGIEPLAAAISWPAVSGLAVMTIHAGSTPSGIVLDRESPPPKPIALI